MLRWHIEWQAKALKEGRVAQDLTSPVVGDSVELLSIDSTQPAAV